MVKKKKTAVKKAVKKTAARKVVKKKSPAGASKRKSGLTQLVYAVSPELEEIVGAKKLTRPQIVQKLWVYIKAKKCQDPVNRRMIVPDAKLSMVLGKKPIDMLKIAGALTKHIKKI